MGDKRQLCSSRATSPYQISNNCIKEKSMKTSYCKGHKYLLYCKVLGRSNREIVTISSYNDDRIKNRED